MIEIASADNEKGILQKDIAEKQQISNKYLDQIIYSLKKADLISNVKGKKSGYKLNRPADKITAFQIHQAFEKEVAIINCLSKNINCDMEDICQTRPFWNGLNALIIEYFSNATLEDLVQNKAFL